MKNNLKSQALFFDNYFASIKKLIDNVDQKKLINISNLIEKSIKRKKKIFIAGNGGSASVANHFLCDFNKGIKISSKYKMIPKVHSLN